MWLWQRETAQVGVSARFGCGRESAGRSECSVLLWQRETAQDGMSAQYVCGRESAGWSECSVWLWQRERQYRLE